MRISELMKKAFLSSCLLFSSVIVVFSLSVLLFSGGSGMNPQSVFLLFPFSYLITLANYILKYANLAKGSKIAIHFLIYTVSTIAFIYAPHGSAFSPQSVMILFALYVIVYIASVAIYFGIKSSKLRKTEKKTEYKNVY